MQEKWGLVLYVWRITTEGCTDTEFWKFNKNKLTFFLTTSLRSHVKINMDFWCVCVGKLGRRHFLGVNFLHLLSEILTAVASLATVYLHKWLLRRSLETNAERPSHFNRTLKRSGLSLCAGWYLLMSRLLALGERVFRFGSYFYKHLWMHLFSHDNVAFAVSTFPAPAVRYTDNLVKQADACIARVGFWHLRRRHVHSCNFEPSACTVAFENVNKNGITRW